MTSTTLPLLGALELEKAPSDTARAGVLHALLLYAQECGLVELAAAAKAAMPLADPFHPPAAWRRAYAGRFREVADSECGVDPDEAGRYSVEFWQGLTDAQRVARLVDPSLGAPDGDQDAEALNNA